MEDIKRMIDSERYISFINDEAKYLYSQIGGRIAFDSYETFNHTRDDDNYFIEEKLVEIEEFTETLTTANSTKAYWCLVKVLDGYDSKYYYGKDTYTDTIVSAFIKSEDVNNTNEFDDVLAAIEKAAVFYINNVATYKGNLKNGGTEKRALETNLARNNLKKHLRPLLVELNEKQFLEDNKILYTFTSEAHKVNPSDKTLIDNIESRDMSPNNDTACDIYKNDHLWYRWIDKIDYRFSANKVEKFSHTRDDCSGFAKLVTVLANEGENINIYNAQELMNINLENINNQVPVVQTLLNNGYEVFIAHTTDEYKGKCVNIRQVDGINTIVDIAMPLSIDFLEPGDMLIANNLNTTKTEFHIEFYVGYDYPTTQYYLYKKKALRNELKKFGIKSLGEGKRIKISDDGRAEGTFSWGNVNDEFPTENKQGNFKHYFYFNPNGYFQHCECGKHPMPIPPEEHSITCSMNEKYPNTYREYKVIWRKYND